MQHAGSLPRFAHLSACAASAGLTLFALGCSSGPAGPVPTGDSARATTATAPAGPPNPLDPAAVQKAVNPRGLPAYSGPTATLRGVIRVTGDAPPAMPEPIPAECAPGAATHGKLFRVGQDAALADVLVAVTGYDAYVPAAAPMRRISVDDCAWSARTVGMTFGQGLEILNRDTGRTYIPVLQGMFQSAQLVAMPKGDPVRLFPRTPARYPLLDEQGRRFMTADVFVLKFATFDVTGLDGRYEIKGIPVGAVQASALLPAAKMKALNQDIVLKEGDNTLDFTIPFDANHDTPPPPPPEPSATAP